MKNNISRKEFLALSALSGLGLMAGCATTATARSISPDGKLRHACIGVRGMGGVDLPSFQSHPRLEIVALCDVDKNHLAEAAKEVPGARQYTDWRELLAKEAGNIDSVNIAVPDHMQLPAQAGQETRDGRIRPDLQSGIRGRGRTAGPRAQLQPPGDDRADRRGAAALGAGRRGPHGEVRQERLRRHQRGGQAGPRGDRP
jgi:hypothetical protein